MSTIHANDEESIFAAAIQCECLAKRAAFLNGACAGDQELKSRIEALLRSHEEAGTFLNVPATPAATLEHFPQEPIGTQIGPYKLRELLGEGGMGVVYVASQEQPIRRKVAIKVIKPGMDSRQVLGRFEAERKTLALMDHPNIAKVLDAGTTVSGRPYFVMELVRGIPITEFCDQRRLNPAQRLELFVQVCRAIQHAHQKGIIHRDIKPSNILVTMHDDLAVPKVIDFGIAKATGESLTEQTVYTAFSQMIGTPLYMSPEQAEINGLDVDTRSDVYSLSVLLYELLTGNTPFDGDTFRQAGFDEMRRLIREVDPPRPSQRVSTLSGEAASTMSQSRGIDQRRLRRSLRGDLDWIVMKALEKDRNRRYETASDLAADVQRHLDGEPIQARPPRLFAGARRWCRRHRTATTTSVVTTILLLIFATAMAADRRRQVMENNRFVETSLQSARTALEANNLPQASQRLAEAQSRIHADQLTDEALVRHVFSLEEETKRYAKLLPLFSKAQSTRSNTQAEHKTIDDALALYGVMERPKSIELLRTANLPEAHIHRVIDTTYELLLIKADLLSRWSLPGIEPSQVQLRKQQPAAVKYLEKAASIRAPSRGWYWLMANCARIEGNVEEVTRFRKLALETPPHHAGELFYIDRDHRFGIVPNDSSRSDAFEQSVQRYREMLRVDPSYKNGFFFMALGLYAKGRFQEALIAWYGYLNTSPDDWVALNNCAETHRELTQYHEAITLASKAIALKPERHASWVLRALAYKEEKKFSEAITDFERAIALQTADQSYEWYPLNFPLQQLASLLASAPDDDLRDGKRAVELATKACQLTDYKVGGALDVLAAAYAETGDFETATNWSNKSLELASKEAERVEYKKRLESFRHSKPWRLE